MHSSSTHAFMYRPSWSVAHPAPHRACCVCALRGISTAAKPFAVCKTLHHVSVCCACQLCISKSATTPATSNCVHRVRHSPERVNIIKLNTPVKHDLFQTSSDLYESSGIRLAGHFSKPYGVDKGAMRAVLLHQDWHLWLVVYYEGIHRGRTCCL